MDALELAGVKGRIIAALDAATPDPEVFPVAERGEVADIAGRLAELQRMVRVAKRVDQAQELVARWRQVIERGAGFVAAQQRLDQSWIDVEDVEEEPTWEPPALPAGP
jgi:hypothetical protein